VAVTKERVLAEIKRTTAENDGAPLGVRRFEQETGIREHEWRGKFWRAWSDALIEAGFSPNVIAASHVPEDLVLKLIELSRKLGRFPPEVDLKMERAADPSFPSMMAFRRHFGNQPARIEGVRTYVSGRPDYRDVLELLPAPVAEAVEGVDDEIVNGHVYLLLAHLKSGKRYKIGHTESVPRRHRQIALELPEKPEVVHVIATDDPSGIETYWHNRFASKRTNGEWFALTPDDVRAFRRRKSM
jgi:hypothetical protein